MTSNAGREPLRFKLSRLLLLLALVAAPVRSAPLGEMLVDLELSYYTLGSDPIYLGTVGGKAIFRTRGEPNALIWITDGTPEGTQPLEIWTRGEVESPELLALGTAGAHFFLLERHQGPSNDAILAIDDQGTVTRVIESGDTWEFLYFGSPGDFRVAGRKLALELWNQAVQQSELAFIDGDTLATEIALTATTGGFELLGAIRSDLVFSRLDYDAAFSTLWRSGGTAATTSQVATVAGVLHGDGAASGESLVYFSGSSGNRVGDLRSFQSSGSMQVRILSRRYSWSRNP